jgi:hypothetical protein
LAAELQQHLTDDAAQPAPPLNHRNGSTPKTVQTDTSALRLADVDASTLAGLPCVGNATEAGEMFS